jgi:molybdopterin biosynthesis enzyme
VLAATLLEAAEHSDALITVGGPSAGRHNYLKYLKQVLVRPMGAQDAGMVHALAAANAWMVVPPRSTTCQPELWSRSGARAAAPPMASCADAAAGRQGEGKRRQECSGPAAP